MQPSKRTTIQGSKERPSVGLQTEAGKPLLYERLLGKCTIYAKHDNGKHKSGKFTSNPSLLVMYRPSLTYFLLLQVGPLERQWSRRARGLRLLS